MKNPRKQRGFTLLEILIALFIFAILGVMAAIGLNSVIKTHSIVSEKERQIERLEIAITLMRRDFIQIVNRPIIDGKGNPLAPVLSDSSSKVEFTHAGLVNPLAIDKRSNMQRVEYTLAKDKLLRITWPVLDRLSDTKPQKKVLLDNVESLKIQYVDNLLETHNNWPLAQGSNIQLMNRTSPLPKAIIVTMQLKNWGNFQAVFPVTRGFYASAAP